MTRAPPYTESMDKERRKGKCSFTYNESKENIDKT